MKKDKWTTDEDFIGKTITKILFDYNHVWIDFDDGTKVELRIEEWYDGPEITAYKG